MKYYLCKVTEGPLRLEATQADAKAVDPNFVQHDVPDDKEGRRIYMNKLLADLHDAKSMNAAPIIAEGAVSPDAADKVVNLKMDNRPVILTSKDKPREHVRIVDIMNRTSIEEALWASEEQGLVILEECIAERRKELAAVAHRDTVSPPARKRSPPKS